MAVAGGPTQISRERTIASANSGFSARNPTPGCTASAPEASAAATTASTSSRSSAVGPSVAGTIVSIPRRRQVRATRTAISPRLAMNSDRIERRGACCDRPPDNASIASFATSHRPPTRRAGSRPAAIHRWTVRVVVPIRAAACLGLSSWLMNVASVAYNDAPEAARIAAPGRDGRPGGARSLSPRPEPRSAGASRRRPGSPPGPRRSCAAGR